MKKIVKAGLLSMSVLMLMTGCSGKDAETDATSASTSEAAEESKEYVAGELKTLAEYKGVTVEVPEVPEITDEDVEQRIAQLLSANPIVTEITDRAAQDGDTVNIDFTGYKDGEAFDGGAGTGYDLVLGSDTFIDGFEDGLIGTKAGDKKDLNLTFPENYGQADLAGADVVFEVTVNAVTVQEPAELNEEFVQRVSDFQTVEEYRQDVRSQLEQARQMSIDNYIGSMVINYLVENSDIICDSEKLEAAFETQRANMENQMAMYGMTVESYLSMVGTTQEDYEEQLHQAAEYSVKQEMILDEIISRENIQADDSARQKVAEMYGDTVETMTGIIGESMMDDMAAMQNALDFLCDNAVVTVLEETEAPAETETAETEAE